MKDSLEAMNCWLKYKSYTASNNIPKVLRETEAVISSEQVEVEVEVEDDAVVGGMPTEEVAFA
jgi:hypothetical protein